MGDLWGLVEANPYRERFVAQLMVALYRSGRKAEALDVYERTRRTLGEDLGLDPSRELQQLSAQIVRQEPQLTLARLHGVVDVPGSRRRIPVMVGASALLAAATVTAGMAWLAGPRSSPSGSTGKRVALVLPRPATPGGDDAYVTPFLDGLRRAQRAESLVTRTYVADELEATTAQLDQLLRKLRAGQFDLVLVVGSGRATLRVLKEAATLSGERIVILDYLLNPSLVDGKANVTAVSFAGGQAAYLAGYLSGLMERRRGGAPRVSAVGRFPVSSVTDMIDAFARGVRRTAPGAHVVVDYTRDFVDQTVCEGSANRQIDRGSHVVFTPAGTCGFGALAAAGLRGVWGVGVDADRSSLGDHVLVSTQTNFDTAVELAVRWYLEGTLPAAKRVVLGLRDDAVGITAISPDVPPDVRRKVAEVAATLRRAD